MGRDDAARRDEVDQGLSRLHRLEGGEPDPAGRGAGLEPPEKRRRGSLPRSRTPPGGPRRGRLPGPLVAERRIASSTSADGALRSRPRRDGTMQKAQRRPQPSWIFRKARVCPGPVVHARGGRRTSPGETPCPATFPGRSPDTASSISPGSALEEPCPATRSTSGRRASPSGHARKASRHGEKRAGILPAKAPQEPESVAVGAMGDGAGVHDKDVGGISGTDAGQPRPRESVPAGRPRSGSPCSRERGPRRLCRSVRTGDPRR